MWYLFLGEVEGSTIYMVYFLGGKLKELKFHLSNISSIFGK